MDVHVRLLDGTEECFSGLSLRNGRLENRRHVVIARRNTAASNTELRRESFEKSFVIDEIFHASLEHCSWIRLHL